MCCCETCEDDEGNGWVFREGLEKANEEAMHTAVERLRLE